MPLLPRFQSPVPAPDLLLWICLLWGLGLLWGLPARALPPSDSAGTSAVAQDEAGTIWALPLDNSDGALRRRQAGVWVTQTVPGAAGFRPRMLTRGADGAVYAFWQTYYQGQPPGVRCLVTVQRGLRARLLAHFPGAVVRDVGFSDVPTLFAGAGGDVWIAGSQPLLWHVSPDGTVATFPLKPEQCFGGKLPQSDYPPHPFSSLTDDAGRRWFWQEGTVNWPPNTLRGVLIWDGTALAYHPTLPGVPDRPYSLIVPLDKDHFRLAIAGDYYEGRSVTHGALYQVDTRTLSAVAETPPHPGAFQNIQQIFRASGDGYVVDHEPSAPGLTLWRQRAGSWQKRMERLEGSEGYYQQGLQRPWLVEPSGVWIGMGSGAWWLPRDGQPALWADWRRGLPALDIIGLFPLANGRILAVDPQGTAAEMPPTPQPVLPLPPGLVTGGLGAPKSLGPLLSDLRQHLWGTRFYSAAPFPLHEWDGKRWQTHLPPKSITGISSLFGCDAMGRIWLTSSHWNPPAQPQPIDGRVVYDPARDTWTDYPTVADALQAAALLPGMAFPSFRTAFQNAFFSGDGRVAYVDNTTIYLYNGHVWQHWEARDILHPLPRYSNLNLERNPSFNADGHLEVVLNDHLWDWTPHEGWQPTGAQSSEQYVPPVPPGGPAGLWSVPAVDSEGTKWFTWHNAVYTARYGLWVKQAELSAPGSPFHYGYNIQDVLRDPAGRLFFTTQYDLVAWSPPPVPRPTLAVVPVADDAVTVRFRETLSGPHWFRWRLGGSHWSAPTATDTVWLTALRRGDYRVEAQALDRRLLSSPPAVAVFSIRVAPGAQIARWVRALLSGPDDAREAAVAGLVKQPDDALPALRAAQPGASEAGRWWLDAAIQQIMDQSQVAGAEGIRDGAVP